MPLLRARQESLSRTTYTPWQDVLLLVVLFCLWKAVLFSIVLSAPGPGYDTSGTLLIGNASTSLSTASVGDASTSITYVLKFVRWDAIYFIQITQRLYVFEQEWAFGPGFPSVVAFFQSGIYHQTWISTVAKQEQPYRRVALMMRF